MKRSGEPTENLGQNQHPSAPYQRGQRPRYPRITPRRPRAVRSQLSSIRAKTGANSLRELVRQVAVLPPLLGALRQS